MKVQKDILKKQLAEKLIGNKIFWSYSDVKASDIEDSILIEKVLIHLDLDDINSLFEIYSYKRIKEIWRKEILIQEPFFHSLNILLAFLYFKIKKPEKYILTAYRKHLISLR
jgi:hypothetical protein